MTTRKPAAAGVAVQGPGARRVALPPVPATLLMPTGCHQASLLCGSCLSSVRRWAVTVNGAATTQTSTTVKITPPTQGGPFERFVLALCPKPASSTPDWPSCPQVICLPAQAAACPVSGLTASKGYTVSALAVSSTTIAQRSAASDFATLPWP